MNTSTQPASTASPGPQPAPEHSTTAVPGGAGVSPSEPTPAPSRPTRRLSGDTLGRQWLEGFLTRSSRDDDSWQAAIADLTTPATLESLRARGPEEVGLDDLSTWRVAKIAPLRGIDTDPDTPTRQTLSYAVTVTDGTHSAVKPFQLRAYRDDASSGWLIGAVHQLYSSEG